MKYYPLLFLIASTLYSVTPKEQGYGNSIDINDNVIQIELSARMKQIINVLLLCAIAIAAIATLIKCEKITWNMAIVNLMEQKKKHYFGF